MWRPDVRQIYPAQCAKLFLMASNDEVKIGAHPIPWAMNAMILSTDGEITEINESARETQFFLCFFFLQFVR